MAGDVVGGDAALAVGRSGKRQQHVLAGDNVLDLHHVSHRINVRVARLHPLVDLMGKKKKKEEKEGFGNQEKEGGLDTSNIFRDGYIDCKYDARFAEHECLLNFTKNAEPPNSTPNAR